MRVFALSLLLVACGSTPPPEEHPDEAPPEADPPPPQSSGGVDDGRGLPEDATFSDLLRAVRALDDRRDQDSDDGCLLGRDGTGWRVAADLAVAVRPLRNTTEDLDVRLASAGPVVVLSRWGAYGEAREGGLVFNAITTTLPPRREPGVVWVVTDAGIYVRSTVASIETGAGTAAAARAALPPDPGALFVAAEGSTPLARLREVLAEVPASLSGRVALAVPLADGVRLPTLTDVDAGDDADASCPSGLPPLADDAPLGTLRPDRIVASLGPLRQGAAICVGATSGPGASGGRVQLALRLGPDGRVSEACVVEDATDDPALRTCLVRIARGIAFMAPDPPGFLDVQIPLVLSPLESQRQRPLCD